MSTPFYMYMYMRTCNVKSQRKVSKKFKFKEDNSSLLVCPIYTVLVYGVNHLVSYTYSLPLSSYCQTKHGVRTSVYGDGAVGLFL